MVYTSLWRYAEIEREGQRVSREKEGVRILDIPENGYESVDGVAIILATQNWQSHIQRRHPEVTLEDIAQALSTPQRIYDHRDQSAQRVYQGAPRMTGFFRGSFPLVVVELLSAQAGRVVTAYLTTLPYRGRQRWP